MNKPARGNTTHEGEQGPLGSSDPGTTPFALLALTGSILGEDMLAERNAERYADRVIQTLFANDELSIAERR